MSDGLPKSTAANQTGRLGVTILQNCVERDGWLFRRQDGDTDFGVDGELEVVERNLVTGRLVKCQVKSSDGIVFNNGRTSVQVNVTTYNMWRNMPLLTILFHVDKNDGAIYWTPALAHQPKAGAQSLSIRFEETSDISKDISSLRAYLDSWFASRSSDAILLEIVPFHRIFEQLVHDVDHYDEGSSMPDDDSFRLFYAHALRLRLDVGLSNEDIPTIDDWYMRSEGCWNESFPMTWSTFSEAMHIIRPAYEEAFERTLSRVGKVDLTVQNRDLYSFQKHRETGREFPTYSTADERAGDPAFHRRIERLLRKVGKLRMRFADIPKRTF